LDEGPYNVEDTGVLSADVQIHTIKPQKDFHGDVNLGFGSWGYQKAAATVSGGTDTIRFLLSGSGETSEQYEDGDGNNFYEQIQREIDAGKVASKVQYQDRYKNMDAYEKKTMMAKLFWDITDNQELRLSYTANRSDDVLYPSSKMDAVYDDSDIYNAEYIAKDLGKYSKELYLQLYRTEVEHPMSTMYRKMGTPVEMTHALTTQVDGAKVKNTFDVSNHTVTTGVDYSLRNWDGGYYKNSTPLAAKFFHSIWDVDTENIGLFVKDSVHLDKLVLDMGLRYDDTTIDTASPLQQDNDYSELNGYLNGTYYTDEGLKLFAGFGKSSRVPDGKELYWMSSPMKMPDGTMKAFSVGTPDLDNTVNYEFDLAVEKQFESGMIKFKAFYSMLDDFIAYNASKKQNRYENVDATVYGFELSGSYFATEALYFDYGLAYQRGEKDHPLMGQSGTNMPEIPPLKFNGAVNYDWDETFNLRAELIASDSWTDYDVENGEQELDSYAVVNLKATKTFMKNFEITVGIDNLFDETYAVSNTYKDLILLPTLHPNDNVMLMNEPGRYVYTNLRYRF
jgi:iron complex outermembrane receptor protein